MIRPLSPARLEQAAALEAQCFSAPLSRAGLAALLNNPACLWLAAEEGSRLLGYAGAHRSGPTAQLLRLAVAPEARRRGIGSTLLEALCAALRGAGAACLLLELRESNHPARLLYVRQGFFPAGRIPHYYANPDEPGLIMRKELAP